MPLAVYCGGRRAGTLDMAPGEQFYGFSYDSLYLAEDGEALSLSLPLRVARFSGSESLPFFEGLLPEGNVREEVARQLRISSTSPAQLIRALGKDCAGDIAVMEEDDPYQPPAEGLYAPLEQGLLPLAHNPFGEIARMRAANRLSLAGGQEKIGLYHDENSPLEKGWYVPLGGSPSTHILKPEVLEAYPLLSYNELLCMRLAEAVGIPVAKTDILELERPILVVQRFDRVATTRTNENGLRVVARVRQEDACQALSYPSSLKYEQDGGPGVADLSDLLRRHSACFVEDQRRLAELVIFNYLVGNCDAHAKNYSLVLGGRGSVRLAPAYDLVSTTVYGESFGSELSRSMGMRLGGHANIDRVTCDDFDGLASDLGMSTRALAKLASSLVERIEVSYDEVTMPLLDSGPDDLETLVSLVHRGYETRRMQMP